MLVECFGLNLGLSLKYSSVFGHRIIVLDSLKGFKNLGFRRFGELYFR
jgi:hypothetical protein